MTEIPNILKTYSSISVNNLIWLVKNKILLKTTKSLCQKSESARKQQFILKKQPKQRTIVKKWPKFPFPLKLLLPYQSWTTNYCYQATHSLNFIVGCQKHLTTSLRCQRSKLAWKQGIIKIKVEKISLSMIPQIIIQLQP